MNLLRVLQARWEEYLVGSCVVLFVTVVAIYAAAADAGSTATFEWQTASPQSQGMDGAKLAALQESLARRQTKALLVIRNDKIVTEWYQKGHGPDKKHYTASMAKAIVGGVSLAAAMSDGLIYQHLNRDKVFVQPGQSVKRGDRLAYIWGDWRWGHLHFSVVGDGGQPDYAGRYRYVLNCLP
jgi:murein DD-endopeptidase MepM/ murein hydrolase activator NlpD